MPASISQTRQTQISTLLCADSALPPGIDLNLWSALAILVIFTLFLSRLSRETRFSLQAGRVKGRRILGPELVERQFAPGTIDKTIDRQAALAE